MLCTSIKALLFRSRTSTAAFTCVAILISTGGCSRKQPTSVPTATTPSLSVEDLVSTEKLVLTLQRDLNILSQSAMNLRIPDWRSVELFEPMVVIRNLAEEPTRLSPTSVELDLTQKTWPATTASPSKQKAENARLLYPWFEELGYLKNFKFKLVKGHFADDSHQEFVANISMSGLAHTTSENAKQALRGEATVHWRKHAAEPDEVAAWKISQWVQHELKIVEQPNAHLFREVLDTVVPSTFEREQARRSLQEELVVEMFKTGRANLPGPKFEHEFDFVSSGYHPGVSVVDIDKDGWDDLYVMSRWETNQLFRNGGDGTFHEVARDYGLDIQAHCTSAVFADFDNDGDPDLMLGRSAFPSIYLLNDNGKFVDRSDKLVKGHLPAMVSSVTAADYNNDGLLDVYFSTYGHKKSLVKKLLPPDELREFARRVNGDENHVYLDGVGAPNLLLVNRGGGKFARAPEAKQLEFWQTTFQSSWADYDRDGDADLYVSNDFGPDRLMRNDYPLGFTEVTEDYGHETMIGFGMGATWGDYDLDGRQDLYVSNMYSKAGMRITENITGLDPRFRSFASGNRLYRQTADGFEYVSGLKAPKLLVAKAGWSWGGQFTDFDNDGYLDIYVTSGYFTAPAEVATQDDL